MLSNYFIWIYFIYTRGFIRDKRGVLSWEIGNLKVTIRSGEGITQALKRTLSEQGQNYDASVWKNSTATLVEIDKSKNIFDKSRNVSADNNDWHSNMVVNGVKKSHLQLMKSKRLLLQQLLLSLEKIN